MTLKMFPIMLVLAAALWTTSSAETFQFPDANLRSNAAPNISAMTRQSHRVGDSRPRNMDQINFMDDYGDLQPDAPDFSRGILEMTLRLDRAVAPTGKSLNILNVLFSPASIAVTLALVMLGAGGQTLTEVARVLGIRGDAVNGNERIHDRIGAVLTMLGQNQGADAPTITTIATGVFLQKDYPIKEKFQKISRDIYKSDVVPLDFVSNSAHAGDTINRWVEWRTQGRIKSVLSSPPEPSTKVLLASALYFNGKWQHPFPISNTRRRPFYMSGPEPNGTEEVLEVTMMVNAAEVPFYSDTKLGCKFVTLPYQGQQIAMHIILPNARGYNELLKLKDKITIPILESLISNSRVTPTIISLPRMKLESSFSLRSGLEAMGLRSLFDANLSNLNQISSGIVNKNISNDFFTFSTRFGVGNQTESNPSDGDSLRNVPSTKHRRRISTADLQARSSRSVADQNPGLYADDVYHKVEIEVTETGTMGSAVTAVTISRDGSRPSVRMDRPFLFFIRHNASNMILFWGTVLRPT